LTGQFGQLTGQLGQLTDQFGHLTGQLGQFGQLVILTGQNSQKSKFNVVKMVH